MNYRDDVETSLIAEVMDIQASVTQLQNQLAHVSFKSGFS